MRKINILSVATIVALLLVNSAKADKLTSDEFVQKASMGNQFEIESSKVAKDRSKNENVRQFAERMITDHANAASELETAVASANMDTSLIATSLDKKHQDIISKLQKSSDKDFDKKYISEQQDAHKDAVKLYKDYERNGDNATLKSFAGKTLPTLEEHQKEVKNLK